MRAPAPGFRGELAKYRQKLVVDNPGHSQLPLALKIIDRWRKHPDVEKTWEALKRIPVEHMLTAEEFIYVVLEHRFLAEKLQQIIDRLPRLESKVNSHTRRHLRDRNYTAIGVENIHLGRTMALRRKALTREKTAPRLKFMRDLSAQFQQVCGQPLYSLVATLTEIAFNKETSPEAVRSAHRSKSTG